MAILNGNNYLIWEGEFTDAPYALEAVDDTADIVENADSIQIEPLLNDVATYGIDNSTFEFTLQDNGVNPASFDALTGIITYYPPAISAGQTRLLKYRFRDNAGNLSNEATISISVLARATAWRGLASSYACLQSGGFNTGQANYATLEEYYTDDNSPVVPASTKPNDISDPDYIAPVDDPVSCPLPSASEDFYIWNFAGGNIPDTEITRIEFNKNGGGQTIFNLSHKSADSQPLVIQVESALYDSIIVDVQNAYPPDWATAPTPELDLYPGATGSGGATTPISADPDQITYLNVDITPTSELTLRVP